MSRITFEKETTRGIVNVPGHLAFLNLIRGKMVDDVYEFSPKERAAIAVHGQIGFRDGSVVQIIHSAGGVILRYRK